ncbi:aldo/keto reductase [Streptomyces sp. NPDC085946]|uniref:aldo/keto reductase n=1 Tax=Streptomyces sp. NPDC085946 TaxID=3365744 RepID=UPI0037D09E15
MRMRQFGRTGIEVSACCPGTMMSGPDGNPDHGACTRIAHRALDGGINFIDTADAHGYGETEQIVGRALTGRRDDVVLATEFNGPMGEGPGRRGGSRRWIMKAIEGSLCRPSSERVAA